MATKTLQPSFEDRVDFENAARGLIALTEGTPITTVDGRVVQHLGQYSFLHGECPSTAEPKLWRYGQLMAQQGLWEVVPGIYQLRGFDISNMTIVEGREGIIVIDPLVSNETAVAALAHYRAYRDHGKPVKAMIFSHSHLDHFGGAQGIVDVESNPDVAIIAPEGFMEEALSENLIAGPAMRLRTTYMRGTSLAKCPTGQIGDGLGLMISSGTHSCLPPTITINRTGQEVTIDEVHMVFQNVPGTEAPAEINVYFPDRKALFVSECATHTMHNILPLRGTQVRDAKKWWQGLDETLQLHAHDSEVLLSGHHWPTWGRENLTKFLSEQRDFYAYLHDQTIRMANTGMNGIEIAEHLELPATFQTAWHLQGYYGTVSHNVKAIYQKYLGWYDGRPHTLWSYPAAEEGIRYVAAFGSIDTLIDKGLEFMAANDLRFACTLLAHAVNADPSHTRSKEALAECYTRLGYGAENATWRNNFLVGAHVLRSTSRDNQGPQPLNVFAPGLPLEQVWGALAVRFKGLEAAGHSSFSVLFEVTDVDEKTEKNYWSLTVGNGALTYRCAEIQETLLRFDHVVKMALTKGELLEMLKSKDCGMQAQKCDGDVGKLQLFLGFLEV